MAAWWPGLLWCPVPMALLVWAPDDAWAVVLAPEGRPPYAQAAGRWPQVPGRMVAGAGGVGPRPGRQSGPGPFTGSCCGRAGWSPRAQQVPVLLAGCVAP